MDRRTTAAMVLENQVANMTLDSIGEAVLSTDAQGKVTYLNRKAEEMTGWRREEARGRPMADVLRLLESVGSPALGNAQGVATDGDPAGKETAIGLMGQPKTRVRLMAACLPGSPALGRLCSPRAGR